MEFFLHPADNFSNFLGLFNFVLGMFFIAHLTMFGLLSFDGIARLRLSDWTSFVLSSMEKRWFGGKSTYGGSSQNLSAWHVGLFWMWRKYVFKRIICLRFFCKSCSKIGLKALHLSSVTFAFAFFVGERCSSSSVWVSWRGSRARWLIWFSRINDCNRNAVNFFLEASQFHLKYAMAAMLITDLP